jgi:hypothetical protein
MKNIYEMLLNKLQAIKLNLYHEPVFVHLSLERLKCLRFISG